MILLILNRDLSSHTDIHESVLQLFSAPSEEVKSAAAFALGNISVGNVRKYLPIVISEIKNDPKKRYLLLHALKEVHEFFDAVKKIKSCIRWRYYLTFCF